MKKILVFAGMFIVFAATHHSTCSMQPGPTGILAKQAATFEKAKKELLSLLIRKKRLRASKQKTLFEIKRLTRSKNVAGGLLLRLSKLLRAIQDSEQDLVDRIAQLMKQHPELMKYLPSNVGFLPIMPFLPVVPIRPPVMPRIWTP